MSFKQYLIESRFPQVPDNLIECTYDALQKLIKKYGTYGKYITHNNDKVIHFYSINYKDQVIKICISNRWPDNLGLYVDRISAIIIGASAAFNDYNENIKGIIAHELRHAIQEYRKVSSRYRSDTKPGENYYLEPLEFDAQLAGLSKQIRRDIEKNISKGIKPKRAVSAYYKLLRGPWRGNDIDFDIMPVAIWNTKTLFDVAKNNKRYWRKLTSSIYNLIKEYEVLTESTLPESDMDKVNEIYDIVLSIIEPYKGNYRGFIADHGTEDIEIGSTIAIDKDKDEPGIRFITIVLRNILQAGYFNLQTNELVLGIKSLLYSSGSKIKGQIAHELRHAVQEYKIQSKKYKQTLKDIRQSTNINYADYYQDPIEIDAFLAELAVSIKEDITDDNIDEYRRFLTNPFRMYRVYDGKSPQLRLPGILKEYSRLLFYIYKNKKLWHRFKRGLYNILKEYE